MLVIKGTKKRKRKNFNICQGTITRCLNCIIVHLMLVNGGCYYFIILTDTMGFRMLAGGTSIICGSACHNVEIYIFICMPHIVMYP